MMRVTIEIVPGGREDGAHTIDILHIGNMSTLHDISDYAVWAGTNPTHSAPSERPAPDLWVKNHARAAGYGPLLQRIFGHFGQGMP